MRGIQCKNKECPYLHYRQEANKVFTKEALSSNKDIYMDLQKIAIKMSDIELKSREKFKCEMSKYSVETHIFPNSEHIYDRYRHFITKPIEKKLPILIKKSIFAFLNIIREEEPIKAQEGLDGSNNLNANNDEKHILIDEENIDTPKNGKNEAHENESVHIMHDGDNNDATIKPEVKIAHEEVKESIVNADINIEMPPSQSNMIKIEYKEIGESLWKANRDVSKLERAKTKKCCIIY